MFAGLDNVVLQYIRLFVEKNVNGQQLLDLQPNDLEEIGVYKIGHQEIILEAVELLKNFVRIFRTDENVHISVTKHPIRITSFLMYSLCFMLDSIMIWIVRTCSCSHFDCHV